MLIGLKFGRRKPGDTNEIAYHLGERYLETFRQIKGTINWQQLTGLDFNTEEGIAQWYARAQNEVCVPLLTHAIALLNELLAEFAGKKP